MSKITLSQIQNTVMENTKSNIIIVVPHAGSGIINPFREFMKGHFNVVKVIYVKLPSIWKILFRIVSYRPNRKQWYDEYMRLCEKTPKAFKILTKICEKLVRPYLNNIDAVIMGGAMLSLGENANKKPYFIFTDSTRRLSAGNPEDIRSKFKNRKDERLWYQLEESVYKNAAGLIARSNKVSNSFVNDYGINNDSILVRNFGVGLSHSKGDFKKEYDGRSILFVAKGDFKAKGGEVVLEAFKLVKEKISNPLLIIVGQDSIKSTEDIKSLGLLRDRDKLRDLFEKAHVFILPSLTERFGMTLLEAMAAYTPCIGSNQGAIPEIIADTGFVIELGNPQELASKIITILKDKDLSSILGKKARERFDNNLSWKAVGKDISNFIIEKI